MGLREFHLEWLIQKVLDGTFSQDPIAWRDEAVHHLGWPKEKVDQLNKAQLREWARGTHPRT